MFRLWRDKIPPSIEILRIDFGYAEALLWLDNSISFGGTVSMCVSTAPADFTATTILIHKANHPTLGPIFVLGYENTAQNFAQGANAMMLHLPAGRPMSQENFLDTSLCPNILHDMRRALTPVYRSVSKSVSFGDAQVFSYGIYTVVLASDASQIPTVLQSGLVPADRVPDMNPALFDFYARAYPQYSFAMCCFNTREAMKATPMLMYYHPMDANMFMAPGLDCHTGEVPDLKAQVGVDHWLIASSYNMIGGTPVQYTNDVSSIRAFLPNRVIGKKYKGKMQNGDFGIPAAFVETGNMNVVHRLPPPV